MSSIVPPSEPTPMKRCPTCPNDNQWHPATSEFWHRHKRMSDGWASRCKVCRIKETQEYLNKPGVRDSRNAYGRRRWQNPDVQERSRQSHKERRNDPIIRERQNESARKRYHSSEIVKQQKAEYQRSYLSNPEIFERKRRYNKAYYQLKLKAYCRTASYLEKHKQWLAKHNQLPEVMEHKRQYNHAYWRDPQNQERIRAQKKIYNETYLKKPDVQMRGIVNSRMRRSRKQMVLGTHTTQQIQEQLARQHYRCYYAACSYSRFAKVDGKYVYHIEHTYPVSRAAGTDIPANSIHYIVLACPSCNLRKHNKLPHEWPEGGRLM